jgi:hypothetical protein
MGYELEAPTPAAVPELDGDGDSGRQALERRWQHAYERLAAALAGCRAVRGRVAPCDPAWLAAQLRVAQARQRCREASDDLELYASDVQLLAVRR